jgi:transportin-3
MVGSQQLEAALQTLYHHSDPSTKEQANRWLEAWQQSTEAWQGCHDVLQSATAGLEAQYFAASTLRNKIQREYEDLPPGTAMNLAESLMSLLVRHAQGRHAVRTQLCIALASLAIHVPAAQWGPGGPLAWWASHLSQGQAQSVALPCMLELLTVFPQEAAIHQPAVTPARRRELRQEIEAAIPEAFSLLIHCMRQTAAGERVPVLESFAAWLKLVGSDGFKAESVQACLPLVNAALEGLSGDGDGFYAATDAVIELIYCTSHHGRPRDEMAAIVQVLVPQVMALRPRFHMCAQQAAAERAEAGAVSDEHHHGGHGDPEEDAKAIARLFAEVGEAYTDLIASGAAEVMPPVEALLDVASHPDNDICAISFNFWHRLSRGLTVGLRPQPLFAEDEEPALSKEESSRRIAIFAPHLERLVVLLRTRVRFPDDFDTWHRDERLDFKHARLAVGDTLLDVAAVLGGETIMRLLVEPLLELSTMVAQGNKFDWRAAEAALYCIRCVYRAAPFAGEPVLLSLFAALPSLPAPPQLQYTAALTVGAYADWLAETARASEQGKQVLNALLDMLIAGKKRMCLVSVVPNTITERNVFFFVLVVGPNLSGVVASFLVEGLCSRHSVERKYHPP